MQRSARRDRRSTASIVASLDRADGSAEWQLTNSLILNKFVSERALMTLNMTGYLE
jgi:hypothetical protein